MGFTNFHFTSWDWTKNFSLIHKFCSKHFEPLICTILSEIFGLFRFGTLYHSIYKTNNECMVRTVWNFQDFVVIQILRETNFEEPQCLKLPFLPFLGYEFCLCCKFQPSKSAKIHKTTNSEPLNVLKWQILHF